jgi:hypothetical protein
MEVPSLGNGALVVDQRDERPRLDSRPSEVNRQLLSAMQDELSPPKVTQSQEAGPRPSHRPPSVNDGGLLQQFRSGGPSSV